MNSNETASRFKQIDQAKLKVATERVRAEEKLQALKERLPRLLARRAMEQATDGQVLAIKRDISDFEAMLVDFPLTLQGLDEMERSIRDGRKVV